MVFDLRGALLRKQESETARLLDFEFRQRARTMKLLALALGLEPGGLVGRIAHHGDDAILRALAEELGRPLEELWRLHGRCTAEAWAQLVVELGDPTPHRLA